MISIIVCSKSNQLRNNLRNNISRTIGSEFEWICIPNENGDYGICEAYNKAGYRSKGEILVFVHEDVVFHTENWGRLLSKHLEDPGIGLIGNAGATYKSRQLTSWIDIPSDYYRTNAIAGWDETKKKHLNKSDDTKDLSEVVMIDGMFLAMRREVWEIYPFDENTFPGFHFYDLDISMQIGEKYSLVVCHDILIEHLSKGNYSQQWFMEALKFHKKWGKSLPASIGTISSHEKKKIEYFAAIKSLTYYTRFQLNFSGFLKGFIKVFCYRPFSPYNFKVLYNVIVKTKKV